MRQHARGSRVKGLPAARVSDLLLGMPAPEARLLLEMSACQMPLTRLSSTASVTRNCHVIIGSDQMSWEGIDTLAAGAQSAGLERRPSNARSHILRMPEVS